MTTFHVAVNSINKVIYIPSGLRIKVVQEETQNVNYGAGLVDVSSRLVRFRVANITAKKIGQFVAFWEKDESNTNRAYSYEKAPDFLVITTFKNENVFGQFIFPKDLLLRKGILSSKSTKGKMAIRVYPSWDVPNNRQGVKTQEWQLPYFIDMSEYNEKIKEKLVELYSL